MQNYDAHLRIMRELRMHPWIPEHKHFIDAELAKMEYTDKSEADQLRIDYDKKMKAYLDSQKKEEKLEEEVKDITSGNKKELTIADLEKVLEVKEKKAKKSKSSPTL